MIKIELTLEETNFVLGALAKLPIEHALGLFTNIKNQAEEQLKEGNEESEG